MNELKATINFTKQTFVINGVDLISGDYNSTKITFKFEDFKEGTKILEIRPKDSEDKNPTFMSEIINNEVILVSKDSEEHSISPFTNGGVYLLEVSVYGDDSKLSTITKSINVLSEQIILSDDVVTPYLPIFDELIQEINTAITETNNLNITITKDDGITTITLTKKDGTTNTVTVKDGVDGIDGVGIESIEKIDTTGLTDTYRISLTNNTYIDYQVINGRGITSITKTDTNENVDTYTITYNDGTTSTFTVTNGTLTRPQMLEELTFITNILPKVNGEGNDINLNNTGNSELLTLEIDGKSEQNGTPTPDNPIEIKSVGTYNSETNKYDITVITTGKNLLDANNALSYTIYTGTSTVAVASGRYAYLVRVQPNTTYTFSRSSVGTASLNYLAIFDNFIVGQSNVYTSATNISTALTYTITTTANTKYIMFLSGSGESTNIQLEKGDQATTYESYQSNTKVYTINEPLRGINDVKDELYIENGYLYVNRKIDSVILNGSENEGWIATGTVETNKNRFRTSLIADDVVHVANANIVADIKSNYFKAVSTNDTYSCNGGIAISTAGTIFIYDDTLSNLDANGFKTWLSTHNTEVIYTLSTPYAEEVGEVTYPKTYATKTNITTSDSLNPNIRATALKDLSNL